MRKFQVIPLLLFLNVYSIRKIMEMEKILIKKEVII
jgi:hypothetical protein